MDAHDSLPDATQEQDDILLFRDTLHRWRMKGKSPGGEPPGWEIESEENGT